MALDTLLEKSLSACEAATVAELDELVRSICYSDNPYVDRLTRCIFRCEEDQVHFDKLLHLQIIGDYDKHYLRKFERNGISRGFYLNADATWLLLILPERSDPGNYLSRCSGAVASLSIRNASMPSLDVDTLTGLKLLHLEDTPLLERVERLSELTELEQLTINYCPSLRELPGPETLWNLTKLDLSECESLTYLDLSDCTSLTRLILLGCEYLTKLDLSGCDNLITLELSECNSLTTLNLSECASLTELLLLGCECLTALDLSGCNNLITLELLGFDSLPELDLSGRTSLTNLNLPGCYNLTKLNLSGCTSLTFVHDLPAQLTHLNLSDCNSLTKLDLSGCDSLIELVLSGYNSLTTLDLSECISLTTMDFSGCTSLTKLDLLRCENLANLDLSRCSDLTELYMSPVQLTHLNLSGCTSLTKLDLSGCDNLTELDLSGSDNLTKLDLSRCDNLTKLDLSRCKRLTELVLSEFEYLAEVYDLPAQLTHLNLSDCNSLTKLDLSGCDSLVELVLSGCNSLTELDLSRCGSLTELRGLENLTQLAELRLWECERLTEPHGLEALTQLTVLSLSGDKSLAKLCGLKNPTQLTKLHGLEKLTQLTSLSLSRCSRLITLYRLPTQLIHLFLYECESLTKLDLSGCDSLIELCLPGCDSLTELDLSGCGSLTKLDLSWCNSLTKLDLSCYGSVTELNLSGCSSLTKLDLSGCDSLTELDLSGCDNLTELDLSGCKNLTTLILSECDSLTKLVLSGCKSLTIIPELPSLLTYLDLSGCDSLTELDLSECDSLTKLNLTGCECLMWLDLSECETLAELHGLETLKHLEELDVSYCGNLTELVFPECPITKLDFSGCRSLSELKGLENLVQLTDLTLPEYSALTAIPDSIRRLPLLRRLDLRYMELAELPDWLPEIAEQFSLNFNWSSGNAKSVVLLKGTKVDGMDMAIFDQPYEMVVKWFEERKAGRTQPLNEVKVIFLGDGEAGKTYTISRLVNNGGEPLDYKNERTPGIAIKNHPCEFKGRAFKVNYWDFGGQEIMHSMHRVFLTNRTMYVVLVNAKDDDYQERAEYWLRNIKSFASDAPVLLAFNKIDMRPRLFLDEKALRTANGNLTQIVSMSALEYDQQKFDSEFRSILLQEIIHSKMLDAQWPKSWIELKNRIENLGKYYIPREDYEEMCADCHVEDVQEELLDWFNDLGISFCCRNNFRLENQVILEPRWITNGLYIILFNQSEGIKNGMVPHISIHNLLKRAPKDNSIQCTDPRAKYRIPGDAEYILGIMRQFGLSLDIGDDREFIPMLCQPKSPLDLAAYEADEDVLEFHMAFEYLPNNVLHRLMVERYGELDTDNVWKSGARFVPPGTGLSAVVAMDGDILKFYISHTDLLHSPRTYLTTLKAHVDQIWQQMGLQPPTEQLVYKREGRRGIFNNAELNHNFTSGIREVYSSIWQRNLSITDILRPFSQISTAEEDGTPHGLGPRGTDPIELLNAIRRSCRTIQDEPIYRLIPGGNSNDMEDLRNRRVRDDLGKEGYNVADQTQRGSGKTGRGIGEVDLMVRDSHNEPWTIIEALRVSDGRKGTWINHLDKLIGKYNTRGYPVLYLLTYVDATAQAFDRIWTGYQRHLKNHSPGQFVHCQCIFDDEKNSTNPQYIKVAKCQYKCGSYAPTVYHVFARIPTPGE